MDDSAPHLLRDVLAKHDSGRLSARCLGGGCRALVEQWSGHHGRRSQMSALPPKADMLISGLKKNDAAKYPC